MDHTATTRPPHEDRSLTGLFADLWRQSTRLARAEAELAKAEISEKVSDMGSGLTGVAAGGAILFAGFLVLLLAAAGALYLAFDPHIGIWLSPLIVGVVAMIVGYIVLAVGRKDLTASNLAPRRTIESVRRDAQLVKEHVK